MELTGVLPDVDQQSLGALAAIHVYIQRMIAVRA
jgi:hypothetical protein